MNEENLHIECNHLGSMQPTIKRLVIRGVESRALRINPQEILLGKPEIIGSKDLEEIAFDDNYSNEGNVKQANHAHLYLTISVE